MKPSDEILPKRILIDANFLVALLSDDPKNDLSLRAKYLVERVSKQKGTLIVPMPALAEYLVGADIAGLGSVAELEGKKHILLAPFDRMSAYECATLDRSAMNGPQRDKKDGSIEPWQLIKVDRQIVAIGKANAATAFVTRDRSAKSTALRAGITAWTLEELPLSPDDAQSKLEL
jgi:predicted nucleic acid-binding protein